MAAGIGYSKSKYSKNSLAFTSLDLRNQRSVNHDNETISRDKSEISDLSDISKLDLGANKRFDGDNSGLDKSQS